MSGKYTKKKKTNHKNTASQSTGTKPAEQKQSVKKQLDSRQKLQFAIIAAGILLVIVLVVALSLRRGQSTIVPTQPSGSADTTTESTNANAQLLEEGLDLGCDLDLTDMGPYTGAYVEDGSDEIVSNVMMVVVANNGQEAIQYAELYIPVGDQTAAFKITTLLPGERVVLLELNRMAYTEAADLSKAEMKNVALFAEIPTICEDRITIQSLDGALNITNISGQDITGDIVIYYKNCSSDLYYGGITYRVTISGGLKAGEVRQLMATHFHAGNSAVVFVTCG